MIPDDDDARLVLADELVERGDPRGELVAVQVRLARHGLDAPDAPGLVRRQDALLAEYGARWGRALPDTFRWRFRRGFVDELAVDRDDFLTARLLERETIRAVRIRSANGRSLARNGMLRKLRALAMDFCYGVGEVLASPALAALEVLELDQRTPDPLAPPPSVRRLVLGGRSLQPWELARIAELPRIAELSATLSARTLGDELAARLTSLEVSYADRDVVEGLLELPSFRPRRLVFRSGREGDEIVRALAAWPGLAAVEELGVHGVELRDPSPLYATDFRPRRLDVAMNHLSPEALTELVRTPMARRLVVLSVGGLRDFDLFDGAELNRLVVLDADGSSHARAHELLESGWLPRLGRVTYSRDPRTTNPSDMAPL